MYTVKADSLKFTLPSSWAEITLGQALPILLEDIDDLRLLCLMSGVEEQQFRTLKVESLFGELAPLFEFIRELPNFKALPIPKSVTLSDGREIDIPTRSDLWTTGQKWDIDEELKQMKEEGEEIDFFSTARLLLSVLLLPQLTGKPYSDIAQAQAVYPEIDQLLATEALPLAAFFLTSYLSPISSGKISWREVKRSQKSWRLVFLRRGWRRLLRFMRLRR